MKFNFLIPSGFVKNESGDCYWLKLSPKKEGKNKEWLLNPKYCVNGVPRLWRIEKILRCSFGSNNYMIDFQRLFSIYSKYKDGFIWLSLSGITQLNRDVVTNDSPEDFNKMV